MPSSAKQSPGSIAIVGRSRTGTSIAKAIRAAEGLTLTSHIAARTKHYPDLDADVIIIATKDDAIADVAKRVLQHATNRVKLVVHLAGSRPPTLLPTKTGVARLTLHPIQSFVKPHEDSLKGIFWMASSEDRASLRWAKAFTRRLGGQGLIELPPESLPLYHTLTVFASNFLVLLGGAVEEISEALDQDSRKIKSAVQPLMEQVLRNVLTKPSRDVLSGPIRRNDRETIRKHQSALKLVDPKLRKLYDAFLEFAISRGYSEETDGRTIERNSSVATRS